MAAVDHRWVLSGGLATGKSKVREILEASGVEAIDADRVGHKVLEPDGPAFHAVAERWPDVVRDGEIDRSALAAVVFHDPGELANLESITHPHIFEVIGARTEVDELVVVELPILEHCLGERWRRIVVDCRDDVRLRRAIERGMTEPDAKARMAAQPARGEWLAAADAVIPNEGTVDDLRCSVRALVPYL